MGYCYTQTKCIRKSARIKLNKVHKIGVVDGKQYMRVFGKKCKCHHRGENTSAIIGVGKMMELLSLACSL